MIMRHTEIKTAEMMEAYERALKVLMVAVAAVRGVRERKRVGGC